MLPVMSHRAMMRREPWLPMMTLKGKLNQSVILQAMIVNMKTRVLIPSNRFISLHSYWNCTLILFHSCHLLSFDVLFVFMEFKIWWHEVSLLWRYSYMSLYYYTFGGMFSVTLFINFRLFISVQVYLWHSIIVSHSFVQTKSRLYNCKTMYHIFRQASSESHYWKIIYHIFINSFWIN